MSLEAGHKLAHYEILEPVGKGGMGEVYKARDGKLGRDVAIKVLPEEFSLDKKRLERFEREARLLAQLNHPNIATLHGLEEDVGRLFLVMELVEGETLAERIRKGPIPVDEAIPLFIQIAEGLEAAHAKAIVHRDLKPANMKIAPGRRIKILDFGLAKAYAEEASSSKRSESPTLTRLGEGYGGQAERTAPGVILGTAPYMSPEQARGQIIDKRTDVWAFGCCLFEALTKRAVFLGETVTDTIVKIVEREPQWSALPEATPSSIRRLLRRCLQKDPDRRLRDIGDARIELDEIGDTASSDESVAAGGGATRSRRTWVAGVLAIAVLGAVLWNLRPEPRRASDSVAHLIVSLSPSDGLAYGESDLGIQGRGGSAVAVSPDGTQLAYVGLTDNAGGRELYIRDLAESEGWRVRESEGARAPFFSPDSQWVGFFAGGLLKKVSVSGGTPTTICDANSPRGGSWNEEDLIVFAPSSRTGLSLVSAGGGTAEPLTVLDNEYGETTHRIPMFLPGGDAFLFLAAGNTRQDTRVVVHSLSSGERRVLVEEATLPRYSPSGHLLYVQGGASMAAPFDVERLELLGRGVPVLPVEATLLALSSAGTLVYLADEVSESMRQLVWVNRIGQEEPLSAPARRYMHPRLSPDERRVVVDIEQDGDRNIWMYDFGRETLTRLTFAGANLWPTWSPDGLRVAYASNRPNTVWDIYWNRADGAGGDEALWTDALSQFPRSWSSDGRTLVATQTDPETLSDIWLFTLDGNMPRPWLQTAAVEGQPVISPNGSGLRTRPTRAARPRCMLAPFRERESGKSRRMAEESRCGHATEPSSSIGAGIKCTSPGSRRAMPSSTKHRPNC